MLSSSNSLPIILLFEHHWDKAPNELWKKILPQLAAEGYDTLCCEVPQSTSEEDIIWGRDKHVEYGTNLTNQSEQLLKLAGFNGKVSDVAFEGLSQLLARHVSSKKYVHVAEIIKELPALLILQEVLRKAKQLSFTIKGIDMDADGFHGMVSTDLTNRMAVIEKNEVIRIKAFTDNLFELYNDGKGLVFPCGATHAGNLIAKFKEKNMQDNVLYYFPHSEGLFDNSLLENTNILASLQQHSPELKDHSYCIRNENDSDELAAKIFKEIKSYQEGVLDGTYGSGYKGPIFGASSCIVC